MQILDLTTLITIGIAVGILLYLRSILGQRTGHQKPDDYFGKMANRESRAENEPDGDNVVKLPSREGTLKEARNPRIEEIDRLAKPGSDLNRGFKQLLSADANFSPGEFLTGANMAYEMIVTAFADGDKRALKNLLSREVYESFESAIDQRMERGETVKSSFVGIDDSKIIAAEMRERSANVSVSFESQIVSATFDKDGKLVDGDEQEVARVKDIWTFARDTRSRDPNWKLVATEAEG